MTHSRPNGQKSSFAPIAAGAYGCVFLPRLLTLNENVNTPRGTELISKLMTRDAAADEWADQKNVKARLEATGVAFDGDRRYVFGVGNGPSKVGKMSVDDMRQADNICGNFRPPLTQAQMMDTKWLSRNVRKIDQPNGGYSLQRSLATSRDVTSDFLDIMDAYATKGGLIDNVAAMNRVGVFHNDIKPDNLTISNDKNTISIIDWGLARVMEREGDTFGIPMWGRGQPMDTWMFNIPTTNRAYTDEMFDFIIATPKMTTALMWDHVFNLVVDEYEKIDGPLLHLELNVRYIGKYLDLMPDWRPDPDKRFRKYYTKDNERRLNELTSGCRRSILFFITVLTRRMLAVVNYNPVEPDLELYFNEVYSRNVDIWGSLTIIESVFGQLDFTMVDKKAYTELFQYIFIDGGESSAYNINTVKHLIRNLHGPDVMNTVD